MVVDQDIIAHEFVLNGGSFFAQEQRVSLLKSLIQWATHRRRFWSLKKISKTKNNKARVI